MNFLMRSTTASSHRHTSSDTVSSSFDHPATSALPPLNPTPTTTLEGLIADDPFPSTSSQSDEDREEDADGFGTVSGSDSKNESLVLEDHVDVSDEEGWIVIPNGELSDDWSSAPSIRSLCSMDRSFVFPGEQVHILACLSASKQDMEIITPFKVAAAMSKNGKHGPEKHGNVTDAVISRSAEGEWSADSQVIQENGRDMSHEVVDVRKDDASAGESILRMEDHKRQTETLLQRFKLSHFFVRISESGEPLWSRKTSSDSGSSELDHQKIVENGGSKKSNSKVSRLNALVDRGNFDANVSGGAARNTINCCSLSNGDIVVLLQVNVAVYSLKDPVIEVLQFEKFEETNPSPGIHGNLDDKTFDPCGDLLKWLLPVDNTLPPPARALSPPKITSSSVTGSQKSNSSGSQLFSHFRSYSMSSLPQSTTPPPQPIKAQSSKPSFDLEDWDQYSSQKLWRSQKTGPEGILSFRGVALERERFSVRCGLEGIYVPGRRWKRKLEIIQPVEIHSFAVDCNTDDLLCVQIKNVSPEHTPEIVVYIDAITIVFDEASKGRLPSSLPITCIEAGIDHSLPNLALRRGEEHSFILKPACALMKDLKVHGEKSSTSGLRAIEGRKSPSDADQYAVMVSCRCNHSVSRLFFKQPTSWRPRVSRDIMISVASEVSEQCSGVHGKVSQLPVQVLTLRASNLTSEDLTLTVLAPASFTFLPSVGSLSSSPTTPMSPFVGLSESTSRTNNDKCGKPVPHSSENEKQNGNSGVRSASLNGQPSPISDVIPNGGLGCTHLWLQSRVPLGCVPTQSTTTIKLELLPLTDGIIALDTLQINVKEKGLTYIPDHSLMINATSSISTGII